MRIIAGEYGGRVLVAPKGSTTRPTADRVREALMSTINSVRCGFDEARVLDAFAGSGALGLEALSRGAAHVVFCEKQARALQALKANIATLSLSSCCVTVYQADIFKSPFLRASAPFDLVFLDPPYAVPPTDIAELLDSMASSGLLLEGALISYEHAKSFDSLAVAAFDKLRWKSISQKKYGETSLDLIEYKRTGS